MRKVVIEEKNIKNKKSTKNFHQKFICDYLFSKEFMNFIRYRTTKEHKKGKII